MPEVSTVGAVVDPLDEILQSVDQLALPVLTQPAATARSSLNALRAGLENDVASAQSDTGRAAAAATREDFRQLGQVLAQAGEATLNASIQSKIVPLAELAEGRTTFLQKQKDYVPPSATNRDDVGKPVAATPALRQAATEPDKLQKPADALSKPQESANTGEAIDGQSHPVYFEKIEFVDVESPRLDFTRPGTAIPPPPAARALRRQIEDVCRLVRILFQDDKARRTDLFKQLHMTADVGLRGPNSSVEAGLDNLQDVKDAIADAYTVVRGKLWSWNLCLLGGATAAYAIGVGLIWYFGGGLPWERPPAAGWQTAVTFLLLVPLGTMAGLYVEFIFRVNDDIPYEQLRAINPGRWKPFQRALNTAIVAFVLAGILAADIIKVGVASVLLNEFTTKPHLALWIGFVTGFAFPYVRDLVQQVRPVSRDTTTH